MKTLAKLLILTLVACACSRSADPSRPRLAVSIEPLRGIVENIAGDGFDVVTVMPQGDNPETFEPSTARRIDAEKSALLFTTGLLPFEKRLESTAADPSRFVDLSCGIDLLYGTHTHGSGANAHTHTAADPHIWSSVRNVRVMARNVADALSAAYPDSAETFARNLAAYTARLDSLDADFARRLATLPDRSFLIWHPSLSYFAHDYGLTQRAVSSESKELSVGAMADIIRQARELHEPVLFYQREFDARQAETLAQSAGARLVPINAGAYEWDKELNSIVNELEKQQ